MRYLISIWIAPTIFEIDDKFLAGVKRELGVVTKGGSQSTLDVGSGFLMNQRFGVWTVRRFDGSKIRQSAKNCKQATRICWADKQQNLRTSANMKNPHPTLYGQREPLGCALYSATILCTVWKQWSETLTNRGSIPYLTERSRNLCPPHRRTTEL